MKARHIFKKLGSTVMALTTVLAGPALAQELKAAQTAANNPYHGALAGRSAAVVLAHDCTLEPSNLVSNCSFEAGVDDWTVDDMTIPLFPLLVLPTDVPVTPANPMGTLTILSDIGPACSAFEDGGIGAVIEEFGFLLTPTQGDLALAHGFDGGGPDSIVLSQTVALTGGDCTLQFDYRGSWELDQFGATEDRVFTVSVGDFSQQIVTAEAGWIADTSMQSASLTIPGCGTSPGPANLVFEWFVPQNFTGPAGFTLDNVQLVCAPSPAGCSGAIADLGDQITGLDLDPALEGDLLATVANASSKLDKGNIAAAIAQLRTLLNQIEQALLDGDISAADASELFAAVIDILDGLT